MASGYRELTAGLSVRCHLTARFSPVAESHDQNPPHLVPGRGDQPDEMTDCPMASEVPADRFRAISSGPCHQGRRKYTAYAGSQPTTGSRDDPGGPMAQLPTWQGRETGLTDFAATIFRPARLTAHTSELPAQMSLSLSLSRSPAVQCKPRPALGPPPARRLAAVSDQPSTALRLQCRPSPTDLAVAKHDPPCLCPRWTASASDPLIIDVYWRARPFILK